MLSESAKTREQRSEAKINLRGQQGKFFPLFCCIIITLWKYGFRGKFNGDHISL